jgi:hypothetical protein
MALLHLFNQIEDELASPLRHSAEDLIGSRDA